MNKTIAISPALSSLDRRILEERVRSAGYPITPETREIAEADADKFISGGFTALAAAAAKSGDPLTLDAEDADSLPPKLTLSQALTSLVGQTPTKIANRRLQTAIDMIRDCVGGDFSTRRLQDVIAELEKTATLRVVALADAPLRKALLSEMQHLSRILVDTKIPYRSHPVYKPSYANIFYDLYDREPLAFAGYEQSFDPQKLLCDIDRFFTTVSRLTEIPKATVKMRLPPAASVDRYGRESFDGVIHYTATVA